MEHQIKSFGAALAALLLLTAGGCSPSQGARSQPSPTAPVHSFAGGCNGTVLTDAEPPVWAQGGWTHTKGTPWSVPWAMGGADSVAYLFATQLVAGGSPRSDGTNNKVLWVAKGNPAQFVVEGYPRGKSGPVLSFAGGPSTVDVPTPGCWTFRLLWGPPDSPHSSIINLEALPAGTLPAKPAGA